MPVRQSADFASPDRSRIYPTSTEAAFLPVSLLIELFGRDYASLRIGVKVHLLAVLDAFAFPSTVIGFKLGNLHIARLENPLDCLLAGHPVWPRLIGPCQV